MEKQPFDGRSKDFYEHLFQKLGLPIETELSVFTSSRTIDLVVLCLESNRPAIQNTIFEYFSSVNDLELKGENDPLTLEDRAAGQEIEEEIFAQRHNAYHYLRFPSRHDPRYIGHRDWIQANRGAGHLS